MLRAAIENDEVFARIAIEVNGKNLHRIHSASPGIF
jgi:hypothetical protein